MSVAPTYSYFCKVLAVVDGDTVDLEAELERRSVDLGFGIRVENASFYKFRTRLLALQPDGTAIGVNAPERGEVGGPEATAFVRQLLPVGFGCWARTFRQPGDKYGRWLALISTGSTDVGAALLEAGLAFPTRMGALLPIDAPLGPES